MRRLLGAVEVIERGARRGRCHRGSRHAHGELRRAHTSGAPMKPLSRGWYIWIRG